MESTEEHQIPPGSRFLRLPREIRDPIYEHVLIKGIIPIECAITKASSTRAHSIGRWSLPQVIDGVYTLRAPWSHRRVWSIPSFDIAPGYFDHDHFLPSAVHMTYQIEKERAGCAMEDVDVSLLQVCKQTYVEAIEIFYGKNTFSFTSDFRIPCVFAFLCDRPASSLLHVKSLEMSLMEGNNLRGTTQAPYPIIRRSTDSLVLQYSYQYFTELCTLLSTPRLKLRRLCLTIETTASYADDGIINLRDGFAREKQKMNTPRPWIPIWLDPLLKVVGLESIEVRWVSNRPQIQRMVDTMSLIQQHMVIGTPSKHTFHVLTECLDGSKSLRLRRQCDNDSHERVTAEEDPSWNEIVLDNNGLKDDERDEDQDFKLFTDRPHCREILEGYGGAYASYFELKST